MIFSTKKTDDFLKLNKRKLPFVFMASSILHLTIILVPLIIGYKDVKLLYEKGTLIIILLIAGVALPLCSTFLFYQACLSKGRSLRQIFSKPPFDELYKVGFTKSYINEERKLHFTEEIRVGSIDEFKVECNVTRGNLWIQFQAYVEPRTFEKKEFKLIKAKLQQDDIFFDKNRIIKMYFVKRAQTKTIHQLKINLEEFIGTLKILGFETE